jgi:hypothetical protein
MADNLPHYLDFGTRRTIVAVGASDNINTSFALDNVVFIECWGWDANCPHGLGGLTSSIPSVVCDLHHHAFSDLRRRLLQNIFCCGNGTPTVGSSARLFVISAASTLLLLTVVVLALLGGPDLR